MNTWEYWALFAIAVLLIVAVPLCSVLERRSDERAQEAWNRLHRPQR